MNAQQDAQYREARKRLERCSEQIDQFKAMALECAPREKLELYNYLEDLVIQERGARVELKALKRAPADSWQAHQARLEEALEHLNRLLDALPSRPQAT